MTSAVIYADSPDACMKAGDLIHSKVNWETHGRYISMAYRKTAVTPVR